MLVFIDNTLDSDYEDEVAIPDLHPQAESDDVLQQQLESTPALEVDDDGSETSEAEVPPDPEELPEWTTDIVLSPSKESPVIPMACS